MVWVYVAFVTMILALLVLDLGVINRKAHVIGVREALGWSTLWISLGLAFGGVIYLGYEQQWFGLGTNVDLLVTEPVQRGGVAIYNDGWSALTKYLTGYLVEKSLAIDNLFVIAIVFGSFGVPAMYQHRVLFWGIVGALVMRGAMIAVGVKLLAEVSWVIYIFGGFLIVTGVKMLVAKEGSHDHSKHPLLRLWRRLMPVSERYHGQHFFVRGGSPAAEEAATPGAEKQPDSVLARVGKGVLVTTPLFLALLMIELTDVVFAVDSIPAIFAITGDAFLVFSSNVMAMLGLRSLYFALAGMMSRFKYLKVSLAAILMLVGGKMLAHSWLKDWLGAHFNLYMLAAILGILAAGVAVSMLATRGQRPEPAPEAA